MNNIEKKIYPDKTFYPQVNSFEPEITFKINSYEDLWYLRQIKDVYDTNKYPLSVVIPCLLDGQADRRFNLNESANLRLVCQFINSMRFEKISLFHPHNTEVVENLIDNCYIYDNSNFIAKVFGQLTNKYQYGSYITAPLLKNDLILMSTDAGGFKPLMKLVDKIGWTGETFSASKSRKYEDGKSKLIQQIDREDFQGKNILIIDDLCVYGGTFIGLAKLLKEKNIGKLYLAISHITVPNPNPELNIFDKIFTTNSKYNEYEGLTNLTIIDQF